MKRYLAAAAFVAIAVMSCTSTSPTGPILRGVSTRTPLDAIVSAWSREAPGRSITWVSSPAQASQFLAVRNPLNGRPNWAVCSQGAVAYLLGQGMDLTILATTYTSDQALRPIWRKERRPRAGGRTLFVPASSIELALVRFLQRESIPLSDLHIMNADGQSLASIAGGLAKNVADETAIDFAVLPDPYLTDLLRDHPATYEVGGGGLYELHYSIVARRSDVAQNTAAFEGLLRELLATDQKLELATAAEFDILALPGSSAPGERFPRWITFARQSVKLQLRPSSLRTHIVEELSYLVTAYPNQFRMPANLSFAINAELLQRVAPERVKDN